MKRRMKYLASLLSVTMTVGLCAPAAAYAADETDDAIDVFESSEVLDTEEVEEASDAAPEAEEEESVEVTEDTEETEESEGEEAAESSAESEAEPEEEETYEADPYGEIPGIDEHLEDYTEKYGLSKHSDQRPLIERGDAEDPEDALVGASGKANYLGIFIEFPDTPKAITLDDPYTLKAADMVMNGEGGENVVIGGNNLPVVSLSKYLRTYSYGSFDVKASFFPKNSSGTTVSYQAPHSHNYYKRKTASNPEGYTPEQQASREQELLEGALKAAKSSIEAQFSGSDLDTNGDNYIDAISFFVEGEFSEKNVSWSDLLWSHKSEGYFSTRLAGKTVGTYNLIDARDSKSAGGIFSNNSYENKDINSLKLNRAGYGVIHHEFLHTLGLPDLYRSATSEINPVGFYDIMANTLGLYPQPMLTVQQKNVLGWGSALPEVTKSQEMTISRPKYTSRSEQTSFKIYSPYNDEEYFVAEYYEKQPDPYQGNSGREDGFIVYRVNEKNGTNMGSNGMKDYIYVFRPNETTLGGGRGNLVNAVISPKAGTSFGKTEIKNGWDNDTLFYSSGKNSGIKLSVVSSTKDSIKLSVTVPSANGSGTAADPYLVSSADEWSRFVSGSRYVKLAKDIDFGNREIPSISEFSGHLDGNGKTLSNAKINGVGLFDHLNAGEIKDLTLTNISISGKGGANSSVGTLAGSSGADLKNVVITGSTVNGSTGNGVGGLVGYLFGGSIERCLVTANVSGGNYLGGMIGLISGTPKLDSCFTNGTVDGKNAKHVGGFFGGYFNASDKASFTDCAYDITKTGQRKAYENGKYTGVTGYGIPASYDLDLYKTNESKIRIEKLPQKTESTMPNIRFDSRATANFDTTSQVLRGISVGETKLYIDFKLGKVTMILTSNVKVTDSNPNPKKDTPKTEDPKKEEPKTEDPKKEEPKTEDPKKEEPKTEDPKKETPKTVETQPMYRLYNPNNGEHFYTAHKSESDHLRSLGWRYEGIGWNAPKTSKTPVYRLYNPNAGDHHYTLNKEERDTLVKVGWKPEGIGWYSDDAKGAPLYRQYNPNAKTGTHNYTVSKAEHDHLVKVGWKAEGIGWYGCKTSK